MKNIKQRIVETLQPLAERAFCPTGEGGGIDNSCSPNQGGEEQEYGRNGNEGIVYGKPGKIGFGAKAKYRYADITGGAAQALFDGIAVGDTVKMSIFWKDTQKTESFTTKVDKKYKEGYKDRFSTVRFEKDQRTISSMPKSESAEMYQTNWITKVEVTKKVK